METSQRLQWSRIGIERKRQKLEKRTMDGKWKDGLHDGLFLGLFLRDDQLWGGTITLEEEEDKVRGGVLEEEGSTLQEKEEDYCSVFCKAND